jgi:uncharacterized protein involved in outer membrane biogenesis
MGRDHDGLGSRAGAKAVAGCDPEQLARNRSHSEEFPGNLLKGFTVHDLTVTDSSGAPFIDVDSLTASYGLNNLRRKHIEFNDLTLYHPIIVLDRQPGGKWNWDRIFPRDTMTPVGQRKTGWGTWVRFTNLTIADGDITGKSTVAGCPEIQRLRSRECAQGSSGRSGAVEDRDGARWLSEDLIVPQDSGKAAAASARGSVAQISIR